MVEGQEDVSWEDWLALARACEAAGLDGLFSSDHYYSVFDRPERGSLDVLAVMAALAASTERVRLGTMVSPVTFRHPAVVAKTAAAIDHVSAGRFELGLGAGWYECEHLANGFPFPPLRERMTMLEEQTEIVHRLWTEDSVTFAGAHYGLDDCPGLFRPLQHPHPPLVLAGAAAPRGARLAARFADEYNVNFVTPEECREARGRLDAACLDAGREPATLPLTLMTACVVGADEAEARERALRRLEREGTPGRDPGDALRDPSWIAGSVEQVVERLGVFAEAGVEGVYLQHLDHEDLDPVALLGRVARA
jgi:F420-dependent oxidoreductase-like protein